MMKYNFILIFTPMIIMTLMMIMLALPSKNYKFHPINLMIMLIILIFFLTNKMNMLFKSWMPYILFLIMIGGLMVIFMYITSLSNNQIFMFQMKNILISMFKISIFLMIMFMLKNFFMNSFLLISNESESWPLNFLLEKNNEMNLSNLFNYNNKLILFIMNYLFYSMICIMNICYKINNPLRQINNYE